MHLNAFNRLDEKDAQVEISKCCVSTRWVAQMTANRPYTSMAQLQQAALATWQELEEQDYLQAFAGHPKIGDPASLKKKYAATHATASAEQAGMLQASDQTISELAALNQCYENQFGFIFIVCATGKSAEEMLAMIKQRLSNPRDTEIEIAATQQSAITAIRLEKLFGHPA